MILRERFGRRAASGPSGLIAATAKDPGDAMSDENFDRIAEHYDHSLPAHVVAHYLDKRVRFIRERSQRGRARRGLRHRSTGREARR